MPSPAPQISSVAASNIQSYGAAITWTTNIAADSQVDYGTTTSYGSSSALDSRLVTSHTVTLSQLSAATTYHFRVRSSAAGSQAISGDYTFSTAPTSTTYALTASPATLSSGGLITVNWTALPGRPANDWIALYQVGAASTNYLWWQYTNGAASGSFTVKAPTNGQLQFRYLLNDTFTVAATSNTVTVSSAGYTLGATPATVPRGGTVTASWTAPAGSSVQDWIALYRTGAANTVYLFWKYTNGAASGSLSVTAPSTAGTYEFRYLLNNGYTSVAKSNPITVQ